MPFKKYESGQILPIEFDFSELCMLCNTFLPFRFLCSVSILLCNSAIHFNRFLFCALCLCIALLYKQLFHLSRFTVQSFNNEIFNSLYFLVEQCFWPQPRTEWIHQTKEKNHFQAAWENETIFWRRQQHGNGIQQLQKKTRTGTNKFRFVWQNIISVWCVCRCCWFRSQPSCHLYLISTFDNGVLVQWNTTLKTFVLSSQELGKFMAHSFLVMTLNSSVVVSWVWR